MKKLGIALVLFGFLFAIGRGVYHFQVNKEYQSKIGCYWELSDRSSTVYEKSKYIDRFIYELEKENLKGFNHAIFYPNNQNLFDTNLLALKSLQKRLHELKKLKETDFAYQSAMQQITAQEQGEAENMLDVLSGCWEKKNHYTSWNILIVVCFLVIQFVMVIFGFLLIEESDF